MNQKLILVPGKEQRDGFLDARTSTGIISQSAFSAAQQQQDILNLIPSFAFPDTLPSMQLSSSDDAGYIAHQVWLQQ